MLSLYLFDLDNTVIDARARYKAAGPEPKRDQDVAAYDQWLHRVQSQDSLASDVAHAPIAGLVEGLLRSGEQVAFLTAREEQFRSVTQQVLDGLGFSKLPLLMRPNGNVQASGAFKTAVLMAQLNKSPDTHIVVIDDDPDGILEKGAAGLGVTFLKVRIA